VRRQAGATDDFNAEVYRRAALERIEAANSLYEQQSYVLAYYIAGVAVECMLLAYLRKSGQRRDDRHDLRQLVERSGFLNAFSDQDTKDALTADLSEVVLRWSNSHRYRSLDALRKYLNRRPELFEGGRVKDVVKYQSGIIVDAANRIVGAGVRRWKS
jgi:HEPN domain-containing protein